MGIIRPIYYPADKLDRLINDGITPPPATYWDFAHKRNLVANGQKPITYTGGDNGGYFDAYGVWQISGSDKARFIHDPVTKVSRGLHIEKERENEAVEPRDLTNAAYTKVNTTAAKDAIGIDGVASSASTLTATANGGTCLQTVTKLSAENTYSVWIRRKTGTGAIEITDNGGVNWTDVTAEINSNTYTRPTPLTRTQANPNFGIRFGTSGDEIEVDVSQLEVGPGISSSILTTVTRSSDNFSMLDSFIPRTAGTIFAVVNMPSVLVSFGMFLEAGNAAGMSFGLGSGGEIMSIIWRHGSVRGTFAAGTIVAGERYIVATSWDKNKSNMGLEIAINGAGYAGNDSTPVQIDFTGIVYIGSRLGSSLFSNISLEKLVVWDQALPLSLKEMITQ